MSIEIAIAPSPQAIEFGEIGIRLPGVPGEDGLSAYEVAVKNGFVGTEEEWLESLKGEVGATGPKGADGDPLQIVDDLTTGGRDKALSAEQGKILKEELSKSYELIDTITLTENVASIVRTQEPDGTPYKFKCIGVVVSAEIGNVNSGINVLANYNATRLNSAFINSAISTSVKKYGYAQIYPDFGVWTAIGSTSVNGFGWIVTQMTGYSPMQAFAVKESENPYCTEMVMQANLPDATIPAGTVISIYGVRV